MHLVDVGAADILVTLSNGTELISKLSNPNGSRQSFPFWSFLARRPRASIAAGRPTSAFGAAQGEAEV